MASTFFGLNIGASGLATYQNAINTTSNNIANVQTKGYTRQTAVREASEALRVTAKYGSVGSGVNVTEITQERNLYYDDKYRLNASSAGMYEAKLYYYEQIETIFTDDDTQNGFSTIFNKMFNGLDTLKTKASDKTVRNQFINQAKQLTTYFNSVATALNEIQSDCNEEIKNTVDSINSIAEKISLINKEINRLELASGGHANELRDERAKLLDQLSGYVNIETKEVYVKNTNGENLGGTNFSVFINGQTLVDGNDYRTLTCVAKEYKNNLSDIEGLYEVFWEDTGVSFDTMADTANGYLKGLFQTRDGNNGENMKGSVSHQTTFNKIVITNLTVTDPNALNMPAEGEFEINGKKYSYSGWEAELDDTGKIAGLSFDLKPESQLSGKELVTLYEETVVCSKTVDSMGVVYYQSQLNEFIRTFSQAMNDIQVNGEDLYGEKMQSLFVGADGDEDKYTFADSYVKDANGKLTRTGVKKISSTSDTYDKLLAGNISISYRSMKDPGRLSTTANVDNGTDAYDLVEEMLKLQSDVDMFRGNAAGSFLETLLSDVSVDTQKAKTFYNNYNNLTTAVDKLRMSVSGVDEDEEALDLVKFQNAYNLNSKVISVMSELYNKLINETGVV